MAQLEPVNCIEQGKLTASYGLLLVLSIFISGFGVQSGYGEKLFPAYFIFGDSLVDVGNNNYISTFARADKLPFGIDFPAGPTGRFCNGRVIVDVLADHLGLPYPPPYLAPTTRGSVLLQGVSYASAAAGILRSTGYDFLGRVDMDTQIEWFANNAQTLQSMLGAEAAADLLQKSVYSVIIGANDYVNNYVLKVSPTRGKYTLEQFQELLINKFGEQLTTVYKLGARTVNVASIGAIGCIPSQLAAHGSVNGECVESLNDYALGFNKALRGLLDQLNSELPGSKFLYSEAYDPLMDYRSNPQQYGFKYGDTACCGRGKYKGQGLCLSFVTPCTDRDDYVFWDAFHPTEKVNELIGNLLYKQLLDNRQ